MQFSVGAVVIFKMLNAELNYSILFCNRDHKNFPFLCSFGKFRVKVRLMVSNRIRLGIILVWMYFPDLVNFGCILQITSADFLLSQRYKII